MTRSTTWIPFYVCATERAKKNGQAQPIWKQQSPHVRHWILRIANSTTTTATTSKSSWMFSVCDSVNLHLLFASFIDTLIRTAHQANKTMDQRNHLHSQLHRQRAHSEMKTNNERRKKSKESIRRKERWRWNNKMKLTTTRKHDDKRIRRNYLCFTINKCEQKCSERKDKTTRRSWRILSLLSILYIFVRSLFATYAWFCCDQSLKYTILFLLLLLLARTRGLGHIIIIIDAKR